MTTPSLITAPDTFDYSQLDEGIRETVRWLHAEGYQTIDSGDGSKVGMECALDEPMVVVRVPRDQLAQACDNIAQGLTERGIKLAPANTEGGVWLEGTYDPTHPTIEGLILVVGLNDTILAAHPAPENITRRGTSCPRCAEAFGAVQVDVFEPRDEAEAEDTYSQVMGQIGYQAYALATGGKTFDDRDMPQWHELPERIQKAWSAVAAAIEAI